MHSHSHSDSDSAEIQKALKQTLGLTLIYFFAEFFGGIWVNSLALVADSGHMALDVLAIGLSLWATRIKEKNAHSRAEHISAWINASTLIMVALFIIWEAIGRIQTPEVVQGTGTILIALGGLLVNYVSMKILQKHHEHNLNVRSVWLHVIADMMGSFAAIFAGICILAWGWHLADPIFSILIAFMILFSGVKLGMALLFA